MKKYLELIAAANAYGTSLVIWILLVTFFYNGIWPTLVGTIAYFAYGICAVVLLTASKISQDMYERHAQFINSACIGCGSGIISLRYGLVNGVNMTIIWVGAIYVISLAILGDDDDDDDNFLAG